jgi:SAM-dependent methyltransferase
MPPGGGGARFSCNLCCRVNPLPPGGFEREQPGCECGSTVRTRGLAQALSLELFGVNLPLPHFPRLKSIRGIGTSDVDEFAARLAEKFDYRNTFYDREPRFDVMRPGGEAGAYDFVTSSEVFEHVAPPVETAFRNIAEMLKPSGILVLTVPYSLERSTAEHYPDLYEYGFAEVGDSTVLVNRDRAGQIRVFENVVFHTGVTGKALEVREFSEAGLKQALCDAGFGYVRVYSEDYPPFGIVRRESWSLPVAARKGEFSFTRESAKELMEQWQELRERYSEKIERLEGSGWYRLARKLGMI